MRNAVSTDCYILQPGAAQEECCSREDLRSRIESGGLAADTLIYREESQRWVTLASLEEFSDIDWNRATQEDDSEEDGLEEGAQGEDKARMLEEYQRAVAEARDHYDSPECVTCAARLALGLDKRDEAVEQYKRALELRPFDKRLANEIKRSLPPAIYRTFSLLDRRPPFWDDPVAAIAYSVRIEPVPFAVSVAVLAALSLIPYAEPLYWLALTLLAVRISSESGRKTIRPAGAVIADLESFFSDWKPYARFLLYGGMLFAPFVFLSELLLIREGAGYWNIAGVIKDSPLMMVVLFVAGAALLPAALMVSTNDRQSIRDLSAMKRIMKFIVSEDGEYLFLGTSISVIALAWLGVRELFSFIPVAGDIISAAAAIYGVVLIGFITGHTRSRHGYLLSP